MAFQQPARQPVQRAARPGAAVESSQHSHAALQDREPDQSQTSWVLFSPPTEVTTASYLSETEHSVDTPGRSRASDLGSLHTAARSSQIDDFGLSIASSAVDESVDDDADAELDSLDSHLPEFRSQPGDHAAHRNSIHAMPVFPAHDGLGSFRLDRPTLGRDAQEQIFQFERFNPKRLRVDTADNTYNQPEPDATDAQEAAKRERIEAWRLEHSRVLLDEVQRETRRRRKSLASMHRHHHSPASDDNMTWHDDDATESPVEERGFLARITRTVVKDIFGIDERLLEVLLGETVIDEDELSHTPRASQLNTTQPPTSLEEESWQLRILETVSKELGRLVNNLTPHHPGAFSTYSRMQQMPLPYAGLPAIPEAADQASLDHASTPPSAPEFKPTVNHNTQPIPIPGKVAADEAEDSNAFSKDEWERELDIKLVFRYLISRFTSRNSSSPTGSSHLATSSMQDAAARVARVRQHHPLIARARPLERRPFRAVTPSSPIAVRPRSSCASQSTRRSARRSSTSSRHYWDIGGSLGTGSMIANQGPMGSWGEV